MDIHDQSEAIAFLSQAASYGQTGTVRIIETHISVVFLVGDRAFKLKRAIKLPYVDFSTYELRHKLSLREVELNSRATPDLYLGIRRITRQPDGSLVFDGAGEPVDVVVEMARFSQHDLFDRMADEGRLTPALMEQTAHIIADFHAKAPVLHTCSGSANIAGVLDINEAGFATSHVFEPGKLADLTSAFRDAWRTHVGLLDRREAEGHVRLCHGDLHLRNIYRSDGGPRLFDCIDFNDQIATVDVLYDLAFLLMDLWHRGLPDLANLAMNRYLDQTGDDAGFGLLPLFMAVRAAVRAHVTGTQIEEMADTDGRMTKAAKAYFDFAADLLKPSQPRLIAIGGFSGTGKSTLAEALVPRIGQPPGARILESDRLRKALYATELSTRLPLEAYQPDVSAKVYALMRDKARSLLTSGGTVIVNAVFDRPQERAEIQRVAREAGASFDGVWLKADPETLRRRILARPQGASDATVDVLEKQLQKDIADLTWHEVDAGQTMAAVLAAVERLMMA
ncbi:bifunctional aminoglycoside phosphotransferase/ATP-binding protein [Rhizobium sp. RU36D]|uniref:bifunctional aminoglycoside phosphotransferase/ATP-binding protein n=1 Tax=Rhizobium sp. RU36D TaxID=1907415 RepID=UPI001FCDA71B|nr:bifunctional aminoglycoside phosphotransferase/ATP-binding protein [Rhizobium sp. RU36D]